MIVSATSRHPIPPWGSGSSESTEPPSTEAARESGELGVSEGEPAGEIFISKRAKAGDAAAISRRCCRAIHLRARPGLTLID